MKVESWLMDLDPSNKDTLRVKISSTFLVRSVCKNCGKGPSYYFYFRKPYLFYYVEGYSENSRHIRNWIRRTDFKAFLKRRPRFIRKLSDLESLRAPDLHFRPTLHRTRDSNISFWDNVTEALGCECGQTTWTFNYKSNKKRPEIIQRQGKYSYPKKFTY